VERFKWRDTSAETQVDWCRATWRADDSATDSGGAPMQERTDFLRLVERLQHHVDRASRGNPSAQLREEAVCKKTVLL
jgi:hypothetical protein